MRASLLLFVRSFSRFSLERIRHVNMEVETRHLHKSDVFTHGESLSECSNRIELSVWQGTKGTHFALRQIMSNMSSSTRNLSNISSFTRPQYGHLFWRSISREQVNKPPWTIFTCTKCVPRPPLTTTAIRLFASISKAKQMDDAGANNRQDNRSYSYS